MQQEFVYLGRGDAIQTAARFVREKNLGFKHECPREAGSLSHSARQAGRELVLVPRRPTCRRTSSTAKSISVAVFWLSRRRGSARLSYSVSESKRAASWKRKPIFLRVIETPAGLRRVISSPSTQMRPWSGLINAMRSFSVTLLPVPLRPRMQRALPLGTENDTFRST